MVTGFKIDVEGSLTEERAIALPNTAQGKDFCMGFSRFGMKPFTNYPPLSHNHAPHEGIGSCAALSAGS